MKQIGPAPISHTGTNRFNARAFKDLSVGAETIVRKWSGEVAARSVRKERNRQGHESVFALSGAYPTQERGPPALHLPWAGNGMRSDQPIGGHALWNGPVRRAASQLFPERGWLRRLGTSRTASAVFGPRTWPGELVPRYPGPQSVKGF